MTGIALIVADSHPVYRIALARIITNVAGVETVREAANAAQVMQELDRNRYDILFFDIQLQDAETPHALRTIKEKHPGVRVIALSPYEDSFTIRSAFLDGCSGYLAKTRSDERTITDAVRMVMTGKKYFDHHIIEKLAGESEDECYMRLHRKYAVLPNEFKLIRLICDGLANKQIASEMHISIHTVEKYRNITYHKIGVSTSIELMRFALRHRIIDAGKI